MWLSKDIFYRYHELDFLIKLDILYEFLNDTIIEF